MWTEASKTSSRPSSKSGLFGSCQQLGESTGCWDNLDMYRIRVAKLSDREPIERLMRELTLGVSRPRSGHRLPRRVHEARDCADTSKQDRTWVEG